MGGWQNPMPSCQPATRPRGLPGSQARRASAVTRGPMVGCRSRKQRVSKTSRSATLLMRDARVTESVSGRVVILLTNEWRVWLPEHGGDARPVRILPRIIQCEHAGDRRLMAC